MKIEGKTVQLEVTWNSGAGSGRKYHVVYFRLSAIEMVEKTIIQCNGLRDHIKELTDDEVQQIIDAINS